MKDLIILFNKKVKNLKVGDPKLNTWKVIYMDYKYILYHKFIYQIIYILLKFFQTTESKYYEMEKKVEYLILENQKLNRVSKELEDQIELKIVNINQLTLQINQFNQTQ